MNIYLTFDYELFFGDNSGSVDKCLIEPTNELIKIAQGASISYTFFVDVGYLIKLEEFSHHFPELKKDRVKVLEQLRQLQLAGHSLQLHIHPHWEISFYQDNKWVINANGAYKLADFDQDEIAKIVRKYKAYLDELIGEKTHIFRAGGWCIQPFSLLHGIFKELEIKIDSSVFPGGKFESEHYAFDFTKAPHKCPYNFEVDECVEEKDGFFTEYPIASWNYSPLFYWKLYTLGRLYPADHKMIGDGNFLAQPGRKKSVLTSYTWNHVSADGYYASKLQRILNHKKGNKEENMVVIGHPKSLTKYSIKKLSEFVKNNQSENNFLNLEAGEKN